jgi:hypothetical protein
MESCENQGLYLRMLPWFLSLSLSPTLEIFCGVLAIFSIVEKLLIGCCGKLRGQVEMDVPMLICKK